VESLELFCEVGALTERPLSLLLYQYYNYYCFVLDLVGKLFHQVLNMNKPEMKNKTIRQEKDP